MRNIIVHEDPRSPVAEAYRSIRTNIEFSNIDETVKSIVFTSTKASEGKTTTIVNLAVSLSAMDKRVALLDCDFRKPSVHKMFGISNRKGITDVLLYKHDYDVCISDISIKNLDVMTSGRKPSNPSEILSSNSMRELVKRIRSDYDYVFIDTPPVGVLTDASIISSYTDGVIIVCGSGSVEISAAQRAKQVLEKVNAKIIGVVLNRFNELKSSSYYSYYGD